MTPKTSSTDIDKTATINEISGSEDWLLKWRSGSRPKLHTYKRKVMTIQKNRKRWP